MELTKTPLGQIIKIIIVLLLIGLALWFVTSQGTELTQFVKSAIEAIKSG
jgi:hypothetical protein